MEFYGLLAEWLGLFLRWFHVIAGVAWIGASFYFIWLDNSLKTPPQWKKDKGIKGDLWAIHGGGFYEVAKYEYGPEEIPETLHWFKWEAYSTWISGFLLLILIYYFGASVYLIDPSVMALSETEAVLRGLGLIFGSFLLYELACRSKLANSPRLFAVFLITLIAVASWLACNWFSGRGAFIHVGAIIGTIMAANVFVQIIPSQKRMVEAVANKEPINPEWGAGAKLRSVHNNYFTLPLLFIMISNHYPLTYQHPDNYLVLLMICGASALIRHHFNLKHTGNTNPLVLMGGITWMVLITMWVSVPSTTNNVQTQSERAAQTQVQIPAEVTELIKVHCANCHSSTPSDTMFTFAPAGMMFDTPEQIMARAPQIFNRTVLTKDMPFLNKTGMTDEEREEIANWYKALTR